MKYLLVAFLLIGCTKQTTSPLPTDPQLFVSSQNADWYYVNHQVTDTSIVFMFNVLNFKSKTTCILYEQTVPGKSFVATSNQGINIIAPKKIIQNNYWYLNIDGISKPITF